MNGERQGARASIKIDPEVATLTTTIPIRRDGANWTDEEARAWFASVYQEARQILLAASIQQALSERSAPVLDRNGNWSWSLAAARQALTHAESQPERPVPPVSVEQSVAVSEPVPQLRFEDNPPPRRRGRPPGKRAQAVPEEPPGIPPRIVDREPLIDEPIPPEASHETVGNHTPGHTNGVRRVGRPPSHDAEETERKLLETIERAGRPITVSEIKQATGWGDSRVRPSLKRLHEKGVIEEEIMQIGGRGRGQVAAYSRR